ncbi:hypothetical protein VN97_g3790 [Penicillium thymicola]|uniref:Uncharacterized protein n=1 Tax=Penicillium thymicola TaxID=293382 RepID=A0AAI9X9X6_PENTH|nr:hypothetical protein VN97_g3790 [Penicillium thymicola]
MKNKRYRGVRYEVDVWLQRFSRAAIANVGRSFCIAGRPRWLAAVIGRVCTTDDSIDRSALLKLVRVASREISAALK